MRVEVTQEDIDRGVREQGLSCPMELAIRRATGIPGEGVIVGRGLALFSTPEGPARVPLPMAVREFIICFDAGEPVTPFAFDWPEYDRMIAEEADPMSFLFESIDVMLPRVLGSLAILAAGYLAFLWYTATR